MQAILGVIYHSIGGFASGSFYMPYNKVRNWSWESMWIVGGLFSWLIVPPLAAFLTIPDFMEIISSASGHVLLITYLMGVLWGVGGLTYGLGVRYLGMSLGNSVLLGITAVFGALVPPIYYNIAGTEGRITFTDMLASSGGQVVLLGTLVCIVGIAVCGWAGMRKDKELSANSKDGTKGEFKIMTGLIICVISGIMSAFFNYAIEAGKPMAEVAKAKHDILFEGSSVLFQNNVIFVVILWGGLTTNLLWCMYLNFKNKSFGDYGNLKAPLVRNYLFAAMAGTTWFLQFFFYGMGESKLGNGASSWILHMSTIILTSNMWGFYRKEWKGVSKKTLTTIIVGVGIILLSVFVVAIGNSLSDGATH
ncbi:MAG: L-rhamnose/proton symporter RhaT [Breznakibacter sp.]